MRVDFIDQIQTDAYGDQQACAAKETSQAVTDVQRIRNERRNDRNNGKEGSADVGNAQHNLFKIVGRTTSGSVTLNKGSVVLQVFRHILRIERNGGPEVTEEVNQSDVH